MTMGMLPPRTLHEWTDEAGISWACDAYDHGPDCRVCKRVGPEIEVRHLHVQREIGPGVRGLTIAQLAAFSNKAADLIAEGFQAAEVYATVHFGSGLTSLKVTLSR